MKHIKIIATLGKSSQRAGVLVPMAEAGLDIARVNFSHENEAAHAERMRLIHDLNKKYGKKLEIMLDLKGPEVRLWLEEPLTVKKGDSVVFSNHATKGAIQLSHPGLIRKLDKGAILLVDDGYVELEVTEPGKDQITCRALADCTLKPRKSMGSQFVTMESSALIKDDYDAIKCGVREKAHWVAVSHVRTAKDIEEAKAIAGEMKVVAKIENFEAVNNIKSILKVADGMMVARGDLGMNIPLWHVPAVQERLMETCTKAGVFAIVATQMLESMITNKRPTRAEVNDVFTAVRQGANAVMLSGETAVGAYPVEAVTYMRKTIESAQSSLPNRIEELRHA